MRKGKNGKKYRILALAVAVIIVCALVPVRVFAEPVSTFTIQMPVGTLSSTGVSATLTEEAGGGATISGTVDNAADTITFADVLESTMTYALNVSGMTHYNDYTLTGITPAEGGRTIIDQSTMSEKTTQQGTFIITPNVSVLGFDIVITLTDVLDETETRTVAAPDFAGAQFDDFVYLDRAYTLSISGMDKYEDLSGFQINPPFSNPYTFAVSNLTADTTAPEITSITKNPPPGEWTNQSVTITGTVTDNHKVYRVYLSVDPLTYTGTPSAATPFVIPDTAGNFKFENFTPTSSVENVYIWAVDTADNKSAPCNVFAVEIDKDVPVIEDFEFTENNASQALEFLKFGTMTNDDVTVTVTAEDEGGSPDVEITLFYVDEDGVERSIDKDAVEVPSGSKRWEASFILSENELSDSVLHTLFAQAKDSAGNLSDRKGPFGLPGNTAENDKIMRDETKPVIEIEPLGGHDDGTKHWYARTDDIDFNVEWEDTGSGLSEVEVEVEGASVFYKNVFGDDDTVAHDTLQEALNTNLNTALTGTGDVVIRVTATDNVGNAQEKTLTLYVDNTVPAVTNFEMEAEDSTALMEAGNFLPYGTFFNGKVVVSVTADDGAGSGIKEIELYKDGVSLGGAEPAPGGTATFVLPKGALSGGFDGKLAAIATDNVGNKKALPPEFNVLAASRVKNDRLLIETEKPGIGISPVAPTHAEGGKEWYGGHVAFPIAVQDAGAGIRAVTVSLNGQNITSDADGKAINANFAGAWTNAQTFNVNTAQGIRGADGSYTISVTAVDNAGNSETKEHTVFVDTDAPVITDFKFEAASAAGIFGPDVAVQTDYGYYFKEETLVTVMAEDAQPSSGLKSITYFTVDKEGGTSALTTLPIANGEVQFVLPANFKGQVFAMATDNVGHKPDAFTSPNSTIVESPEKHLEETHIAFHKEDAPYTDRDGLGLHAGDVQIGITVADTFSGLRKVEWAVSAPYDTAQNFSGSIDIAGNATLTGDTAGFTVTDTEANLVTGMAGTITAKNNSNSIVVWVKITDRSGNTSEDSIRFSIDKTAPTISVTYDNNSPDRQFPTFYKADRTATIVITERNFRPEDVKIIITNTDGVIPSVVGWSTAWNAANSDATTNTATVRYSADGDYTFDISYADNAKNPAAPFVRHEFTIDKTVPVISVSYDNNDVLDGLYYAKSRTATISITEHNFETSRIEIVGRATDDGRGIVFPGESGWSSRGDTHTATIPYTVDGRYGFTVEYMDKAGNEAARFEAQEFIVDQTPPTIEIMGVMDQSANNGDVIPVIRFSDTNYDADTVAISLVGSSRGTVPPGGQFASERNGQVYMFENFKKEKEIDDIYTLEASLRDRAGNETKEAIVFSVNRFGSVYALDADVQAIGGRYIQNEVDVVVTETNVDSLRHETVNVKLTYNGVPKDLAEGEGYTVDRTGGKGTWSQYRYIVPKAMFVGEGSYTVTLYSVDAAGNVNENIQESKKAEISFGVDKTPPAIVAIGVEDGRQYPVDELSAAISVTDNLVLKDVQIYLNGGKIDAEAIENQEFIIPGANTKQSVRVVAADAAGNESVLEISDILVTTSVFYRWYNNTPLFIGTIIGVCALVVLVILLIRRAVVRRKRA